MSGESGTRTHKPVRAAVFKTADLAIGLPLQREHKTSTRQTDVKGK